MHVRLYEAGIDLWWKRRTKACEKSRFHSEKNYEVWRVNDIFNRHYTKSAWVCRLKIRLENCLYWRFSVSFFWCFNYLHTYTIKVLSQIHHEQIIIVSNINFKQGFIIYSNNKLIFGFCIYLYYNDTNRQKWNNTHEQATKMTEKS